MSYQLNPQKFEAVQLGSGDGAQATFIATVDPESTLTWVSNDDGSVTYHSGAGAGVTVAVSDYLVSPGYWGTFPGWTGNFVSNTAFDSTQLALEYSAI